MNDQNLQNSFSSDKLLKEIIEKILILADQSKEDSIALLDILRQLEFTHHKIREDLFEPSLPNTRHGLYDLLKDIEENGGWPYIERMRLSSICEKFLRSSEVVNKSN